MNRPQLEDRVRKCGNLRIPVVLELHTFTDLEVTNRGRIAAHVELLKGLRASDETAFILHTPPVKIQEIGTVLFDRAQAQATLETAHRLGASKVVLHRSYAYGNGPETALWPKDDAISHFNAEVRALAPLCEGVRLAIENVGFFHRGRGSWDYLISPLDHFFPWERRELNEFLKNEKIAGVETMLDIAHATQSANMFNLLRKHYKMYRGDPRFRNITEVDLAQAEYLTPLDFMDDAPTYYHVSDAHFLGIIEGVVAPETAEKAMVSENLRIGSGNLDFTGFMEGIAGTAGESVRCVAEVNPGTGESQVDNQSQLVSIEKLLALTEGFPSRAASVG